MSSFVISDSFSLWFYVALVLVGVIIFLKIIGSNPKYTNVSNWGIDAILTIFFISVAGRILYLLILEAEESEVTFSNVLNVMLLLGAIALFIINYLSNLLRNISFKNEHKNKK